MCFFNNISRVKSIPKTSHIPGDLDLLMRQKCKMVIGMIIMKV